MASLTTPPPNPPPLTPATLLSLDAAGLVELLNSQAERDRGAFDRLLKWFGGGVAFLLAVGSAVFWSLGYQTRQQVVEDLRQETQKQLKVVVDQELTPEKIDEQIQKALQAKTDAQYVAAINKAVLSALNTPERQQALDAAIHRQVDSLTHLLAQRQKIADLGNRAISNLPNNHAALAQLWQLWRSASDNGTKIAARAEIARVVTFWGTGASYMPTDFKLKTLNGKAVPDETKLTTCELLGGLHSNERNERAQSANLLLSHRQQGVLDALVHAMSDNDLNVVVPALRSFFAMTGEYPAQGGENVSIPETALIDEWWIKQRASIVASLKIPPGPDCSK